jgi:hypothetical protein
MSVRIDARPREGRESCIHTYVKYLTRRVARGSSQERPAKSLASPLASPTVTEQIENEALSHLFARMDAQGDLAGVRLRSFLTFG